MLIRVTEKCRMGCSHCMINAGPNGRHMARDIYKQTLEFIRETGFPLMMISGGEPMEHPDILILLQMAVDAGLKTTLLSNGMFLTDQELTKKVLDLDVLVQITNDSRFYPEKVPHIKHEKVIYEDSIRLVSPFGRALENKIPVTRQSPLCFNFRSIVRHFHDFLQGLYQLRLRMKMCTPSINIDGSISAGESNSCHCIGTVYDSNLELTNKVCNMRCDKCGLVNNLDELHKGAIGEVP